MAWLPETQRRLCLPVAVLHLPKLTRYVIHRLAHRLFEEVRTSALVESGEHILLAVSAGLDSMVMLHLFLEIQTSLDLKLEVVHLNHGLRGEEGEGDQQFVCELCASLKLSCHSKTEDVRAFSRRDKLSIEEAGRTLRYRFFTEVLRKTSAAKVATAHTADDQAETVMDHFLRGSGSAGLAGMRDHRPEVIRPLLRFSRQELQDYMDECKFPHREDSSNRDLAFRRNRIRHELMPYLRQHFNSNLLKGLNQTASIFQEIEDFLVAEGQKALNSGVLLQQKKDIIILDPQAFLDYTYLVQKYIIYNCYAGLLIKRSRIDCAFMQQILDLIARRKVGTRAILDSNFELLIDHDGIVFLRRETASPGKVDVGIEQSSVVEYGKYRLKWSISGRSHKTRFLDDTRIECFDYDKTGPQLTLRTCMPGDAFFPLNLGGKKKVGDFFSDSKVPLRLRQEIPILENELGILWICGLRIDDRFKVTEKTMNILTLELTESS